MNEDSSPSSLNKLVGSCQDGWKHGMLKGQNEARKRIRIRTFKVSDFRNHFLFINEVCMLYIGNHVRIYG
ncbi:hypothetical protein HanIR_Chr06g0256661 [Helianthus annuus]|nr:hypothetical protein HanIR_Chr06g0256661 [Helianthus annuus]